MGQSSTDPATITVAELEDDPYPLYARLRADRPAAWVPAVGLWLVTRWADVERVTKDTVTFPASVGTSPVDRCFGSPTIITCDGEVHRDLRRAIDPAYRPAKVNASIDALVRPIAEALVDGFEGVGAAELMSEYFEPISTLALARSMGFVDVDVATLRRWFRGLSQGATNFEQDPAKQVAGDETADEIRGHAMDLLERLEQSPDDSALSHMLHDGMPPGTTRSRDRILPTVLVTLLGGMQEPGHGSGSVLVGLLSNPDQLEAVRSDPGALLMRSVDEGLRWMAPIGTQTRETSTAVTIGGVEIPAGRAVAAVVASACRDESRYTHADRFDIHLRETEHSAFGLGSHHCTGHWFARHQIRLALEVLLERLPRLRLAPGFEARFTGWEFRAPTELQVTW